MRLPAFLLRNTVTVEPYLGTGAYGPQYGAPVVLMCFLDDARRLIRAANGDEVVSESTFYCDSQAVGFTIAPESRVTIGTRKTTVLVVKDQSSTLTFQTPNYLEVSVK